MLVQSCFPVDNESFLPLRLVCVADFEGTLFMAVCLRDPEIPLHNPLCFFLLVKGTKKKRKDLSSEQR